MGINISTGFPSKQVNKKTGGNNLSQINNNSKVVNKNISKNKNVNKNVTKNITKNIVGKNKGRVKLVGHNNAHGHNHGVGHKHTPGPRRKNFHSHPHVHFHNHNHNHNHNYAPKSTSSKPPASTAPASSNTGGAPAQSGSGNTSNINIIINLLCSCLGGNPISGAGSTGAVDGSGSTNTTPTNNNKGYSPLLDKLSGPEKDYALKNDLTGKGPDGKPMYLIANGKDGKPHLYKQKKPGEYEAPVKIADGNNQLDLGKNPTITTDKHGISQASGKDVETSSPLILDTNKDGKVSAQHGIGVDNNGDGRADGAAVGGDKMLTMGDRNGNGKIDGTEVFGDKTVDPFTNQAINARNGFEALKKVALSAQQATGQKVIDSNGKVDVQKLNQALQATGNGQLGMISGNNVTNPESLGDVASINTQGYKEQAATGNVQHRQLGSYTDTQGAQHKVDDVWFKNA